MADEATPISYEDLAALEDEFNDIDLEMTRTQYSLSQSAYARRAETVAKIPNFWPLVLEQAPPEIDQYIHAHDSKLISEHLTDIEVTRPELDEKGPAGDPRSVRIKLEFSANEVFTDKSLAKTFWYRRKDGWSGLVSEPVKIHWKKGKDTTEGLTDGAVALFEARQKAGDMTAKDLPEYAALAKKVEHWTGANTSFFTWFGYVSGRHYVTVEESELATKKSGQRKEARKRGERPDTEETAEDEDPDDAQDDSAVEVHEAGEELAYAFAEDLWPNAIKYFTQAQEMGDMSDPEFEEDEEDEDDEDDEPIDIRSLVQSSDGKTKPRDSTGPPAKKAKR
ncbi:hypothetical protein LTR53_004141 [Teratosphaeriaceae sp. CCFEE 6253]|nr:hypothetical protein LTR53_004141 [Teratosphaeriaceae sp. CCFEE 6253]